MNRLGKIQKTFDIWIIAKNDRYFTWLSNLTVV